MGSVELPNAISRYHRALIMREYNHYQANLCQLWPVYPSSPLTSTMFQENSIWSMFSLCQDKQSRWRESAGCKHFPENQLAQVEHRILP